MGLLAELRSVVSTFGYGFLTVAIAAMLGYNVHLTYTGEVSTLSFIDNIGTLFANDYRFSQCEVCGTILEIFEGNLVNAFNPFYGVRLAYSPTLDGAGSLSIDQCKAHPCEVGCSDFLYELKEEIQHEMSVLFNFTTVEAVHMQVPIEVMFPKYVELANDFVYRVLALSENRVSMQKPSEKGPRFSTEPMPTDIANWKTVYGPHRHKFDSNGQCSCGLRERDQVCVQEAWKKYASDFHRRLENGAKEKGCPTCPFTQDIFTARLASVPFVPGKNPLFTSAWFVQNPINKDLQKICYPLCEGKLPLRSRIAIRWTRFLITHGVLDVCSYLFTSISRVKFIAAALLGTYLLAAPPLLVTDGVLREAAANLSASIDGSAPTQPSPNTHGGGGGGGNGSNRQNAKASKNASGGNGGGGGRFRRR